MPWIIRQSIAMVGTQMMLKSAFSFMLFLCLSSVHGQNEVFLRLMRINGTIITTRNGRNISAYRGIPYAEPPIGPLRFSNPRPWNKRYRVITADTDGNDCPQFNDDGKLVGNEDCLFLNVYTPDTRPKDLYPVMVYFHGGNFFTQGSGSSKNAGPEYLLDRDIILVTVNYRLGVLGFLSTGDASAPGNFGLKDQALALQWVREYIASFGGHPFRVTIFGQDAGGASTSLHAIFKPDLFNQYISQSGGSLDFWSFQEIDNYKKRAFDLARHLGCWPTGNTALLVDKCLRNANAYDLVDSNAIFKDSKWVLNTWGPTLEDEALEGAFITAVPIHQMLMRGIKDRPAILGNVNDEGLLWSAAFYVNDTLYNSMKKDLFDYLTYVIKIFFAASSPETLTTETERLYFNDSQTTDKKSFTRSMANFLTDAAFRVTLELQVRSTILYNQLNPIYLYSFDYRGTFSKTSVTLGNNDNIGVTHGDDLIYLFPIKTTNVTQNESDEKMIDIMVDFWTSFADTGTPTSNYTSDPNVWKRFDPSQGSKYLKIGDNSDPTDIGSYSLTDRRLSFWAAQFKKQLGSFLYEF